MNALGVAQIVLLIGVLIALVKPLGAFMARVYAGERTFLSPVLGPVERGLYRLAGVTFCLPLRAWPCWSRSFAVSCGASRAQSVTSMST